MFCNMDQAKIFVYPIFLFFLYLRARNLSKQMQIPFKELKCNVWGFAVLKSNGVCLFKKTLKS